MARALASGMEKDLGQPVVIQNKPGALGTLGPAYVAKQAPDGYTLAIVSASVVTTTPHLMDVPVKPEDLIHVAGFGKNRYGIVVRQDSPFKKVSDQIGRASCRERVCQYVYISVVAVSLKHKNTLRSQSVTTSKL